MAFSPDERYVYASSDQGDIYTFDLLQSGKCLNKFSDEGSFRTTHLALSPEGGWLATGSYSGIVNLYEMDRLSHSPLSTTPTKTIMNLTTAISDIKFDPTGDLLAVCSKWKKNALRLIHTPTQTVYQNFPSGGVGVLKYAHAMGWSGDSRYFAMGNDEGRAVLYHLNHFSQDEE